MDDRRWQRVRGLFEGALEIPEEQRAAWVTEEARGDEALEREVLRLLQAAATPDPALEPRVSALAAAVHFPEGARIGPYSVQTRIAAGGMGDVYLARQERPSREVAIKVLRARAPSERSLRRFELEAEILARLEHPAIARVFEAGHHAVAGSDRVVPYFAMEYVRGAKTVVRFAEDAELSRDERLELFTQICEAVQFAHEQGVLHRDLKPGNLLVDQSGHPKVIDFGIARDEATHGAATLTGEVLGTIGYMSPERLGASRAASDARSDVYSLGVVLYELLSGATPQDIAGLSFGQALERLRDNEPEPPSRCAAGLPVELDWISLRAVARDRQRRYASVSELAADLGRYRRGEPVLAGAPSAAYRVKSFLRRHRVGVGLAAALGLGIVATAYGTGVGFERASQERALSAAMQGLFGELLDGGNTSLSGGDLKVTDLLQRIAQVFPEALDEHPGAAVPLYLGTARAWKSLGDGARCQELVDAGLDLARAGHGEVHEVAALHVLQGRLHEDAERYTEADAELVRALELVTPCPERACDLVRAEAEAARARPLHAIGEREQAFAALERGSDLARELGAADLFAQAAWTRGFLHRIERDYAAALGAYDGGLAVLDVDAGADRYVYLRLALLQEKAQLLSNLGRYDEAVVLAETTLAAAEDWLGRYHPTLSTFRIRASMFHAHAGDDWRAATEIEELLEAARYVTFPERELLNAKSYLAQFYKGSGRSEEALALIDEVIPARAAAHGATHVATIQDRQVRASILFALERVEEGQDAYRAVIDEFERHASDPYLAADARSRFATLLFLAGSSAEALELAERAEGDLEALVPADHPALWFLRLTLVEVLLAQGLTERAEAALGRLEEGADPERYPERSRGLGALRERLRGAIERVPALAGVFFVGCAARLSPRSPGRRRAVRFVPDSDSSMP